MQYGISVPPFSELFEPSMLADMAADAEEAGWDAFFLWDHVLIWPTAIADPWIAMAAIAMRTERIRIGALVTPVPRRRPLKLAREVVTLDHLSNGRLIFGVGSGAGPWEYDHVGEETSAVARAEMLDEALDLFAKMWTGEPFMHQGRFYKFEGDDGPGKPEPRPTPFLPKSVQSPRVPVWVAGTWPKKRPFRRAARWDGVVPLSPRLDFGEALTVDETRDIVAYIGEHRVDDGPYAVVISGHTTGQDATADRDKVAAYADVGATWWLEDLSPWPYGWNWQGPWPVEAMRARITAGPPK
jgi:alkanesulfonate monooxygenase SsuD/methylene tetrahydromethanopterin reductase-like flavin-dependent oxidoreductase (luciferase family)